MRITASWSGSSPTAYKDVTRMFVPPHAGSPSHVVIPTTTSVPSCSNPSRTKPLRVALRAILDRFCARRLYAIVGRDEETACQVEQRNWSRNKWIGPPGTPLTKITPYKVFGRLRDD